VAAQRPPRISVIVPVRNGGAWLHELVAALDAQTLPREDFEVIVADDGSTDGAPAALQVEGEWLRVLHLPPRTSYAARNDGVAAARAAVLAFCDADCRPEPAWLERGLEAVEDADLVAGRVRFLGSDRATVWTLLDVDMHLNQEQAVRRGAAATANLFVHRATFDAVGGFDGSLASNGDYDFVRRALAAGARLTYAPGAVVWHPTRNTMRSFLGKIWRTNHAAAARAGRSGRNPLRRRALRWIPIAGAVDARRRAGKPIALNRERLDAEGLDADPLARLRATLALYLLVPPVRGTARVVGWLRGRREYAARPG
jgi:GT2 family glycosyltransferase